MGSIFQNQTIARRYVPKIKKHEESIQKAVCRYLRLQYPNIIFRSDYASGLHLTINQASIHKSLQSGRSFPDLFIFKPMMHRRGDDLIHYNGMALELKKDKTAIIVTKGPRKGHLVSNPHIQEQYLVLKELSELGYFADFAIGLDDAINKIDWYFGKKTPSNIELF